MKRLKNIFPNFLLFAALTAFLSGVLASASGANVSPSSASPEPLEVEFDLKLKPFDEGYFVSSGLLYNTGEFMESILDFWKGVEAGDKSRVYKYASPLAKSRLSEREFLLSSLPDQEWRPKKVKIINVIRSNREGSVDKLSMIVELFFESGSKYRAMHWDSADGKIYYLNLPFSISLNSDFGPHPLCQ